MWEIKEARDFLTDFAKDVKSIAQSLRSIARSQQILAGELNPSRIAGLRIIFGAGVPAGTTPAVNLKGESTMSTNTPGSFSDPDNDLVPYTIEAVDGNNVEVPFNAGDVVALLSTDGNSTVVPNPSDPSGATGNLSAKSGFSGPVSGTATYTPNGATAPSLTGTWTGTFTVGSPATLDVVFGAGAAPAAGRQQSRR